MNTFREVYEALDNKKDNGYLHDWHLTASEVLEDINEQTGLLDYLEEDSAEMTQARVAVLCWRGDNIED